MRTTRVNPFIAKERITRPAPIIHFSPVKLSIPDPDDNSAPLLEFLCSVAYPEGNVKDVRKAQQLSMERVDPFNRQRRTKLVRYWEMKDEIARQAVGEETVPYEQYLIFQAFVAAVELAIPNDIHNLQAEVGSDEISRICRHNNRHTLISLLSHRTEWGADALYLLMTAYPELDLKATLRRHAYTRCRRQDGQVWKLETMELSEQERIEAEFSMPSGGSEGE